MQRLLNQPLATMPYYQQQSYLAPYTGTKGLTGEYLDKMVQVGYTSLFSMAVPILPLLGLVTDLVEIRVDAWKLSHLHQRPFPRQADSLGFWDDVQRAITFFGIIANVLLCAFTTVGHNKPFRVKLGMSLVSIHTERTRHALTHIHHGRFLDMVVFTVWLFSTTFVLPMLISTYTQIPCR
eukprot:Blabericola_migrator_1__552@NODE_1136_length_5316_cov_209_214517_g772_i0_p3_GENE_NODE_1136_length_5316_cov_209_214517_g772_i0NODE_1136_length_5316_cov_209_214517_g772_i0_p3_ORF_typecomplete_len180_score9_80Anoctamin/PF04547_12/1_4e28_NODE_1136_length_5316_cov_209_214517_g772_i018162355